MWGQTLGDSFICPTDGNYANVSEAKEPPRQLPWPRCGERQIRHHCDEMQ